MACRKSGTSPHSRAEIFQCLGLFLFLVMMTGCAALSPSRWLPVDDQTSRQVLETLRQKEARISTLKGLFQISISGAGIPLSQDLNGIVSYRQPDQVHLRGFIRLGMPVLDFRREGNLYELSFPAEGRMVSGEVNRVRQDSEWDQTVVLSLRALDAVLGKIPGLAQAEAQVLKDDHFYRIDQVVPPLDSSGSSADVLVRTRVDAQTLEVSSIEYYQPADDLVVSVQCEDYRIVKDREFDGHPPVRLPFQIRAKDHRMLGGSVTLAFREFILNAA